MCIKGKTFFSLQRWEGLESLKFLLLSVSLFGRFTSLLKGTIFTETESKMKSNILKMSLHQEVKVNHPMKSHKEEGEQDKTSILRSWSQFVLQRPQDHIFEVLSVNSWPVHSIL